MGKTQSNKEINRQQDKHAQNKVKAAIKKSDINFEKLVIKINV